MKIKFSVWASKETLLSNANEIFQMHNSTENNYGVDEYLMDIHTVSLKEAENVQLHNDSDVIVTRGLLYLAISKFQNNIPIIEIPVPLSDMINALEECYCQYGEQKIAIIAAERVIGNMKDVVRLSRIPVTTYQITHPLQMPKLVEQALQDECRIIVGGVDTCKYAQALGLNGIYIKIGREAFWQSLSEAKRVAYVTRREQEKNQRLVTILEYTSEGVVALDENNNITTINPIAMKTLNVNFDVRNGHSKMNLLPIPSEFMHIALDDKEYINSLIKLNNSTYNLNKLFIRIKGTVHGKVITFQEISSIQEFEYKIRRKLHNEGHIARANFSSIIGRSKIIHETISIAKQFSSYDANILLLGKSGTGKELFAQSIHNSSQRRSGPFVAVNCATIAESLLESELFGYTEGAFTGAQKGGKKGFFELADKGTIFLDEIAEIPLALQSKFLRVLQEREIIRLGDGKIIPVDIRIIAATNKKLEELVNKGKFREDLFYRIDVLRINIPSLDKRKEDIPLIVNHYMKQKFPHIVMDDTAYEVLCSRDWPGNVRQLLNICERLAILNMSGTINDSEVRQVVTNACHTSIEQVQDEDCEKNLIKQRLIEVKFNREHAAKLLGMSRSTLWRKMREYNL